MSGKLDAQMLKKLQSSAASGNGTVQGITDNGCEAHDPGLYLHSSLCESLGALPKDCDDRSSILERYRLDGFVSFSEAFPEKAAHLGGAIDAMTNGSNQSFARDFAEAASKGTPDFTSGAKIPWCQYEAGTSVGDKDETLCPSVADRVRKLMGFVGYDKHIDSVVKDKRLLLLVADILQCQLNEVELFQDMALLKPLGGGREKPWHQDMAYFNVAHDAKVVGCWIAIDHATCENGCLRMLRGGHRVGPKMHFAERDYQICDSDAPSVTKGDDIVAVELPPGGLVLFDGMIPHGTPTNASHYHRRALQFHWVRQGVARVAPNERGGRARVFGGAAKNLSC